MPLCVPPSSTESICTEDNRGPDGPGAGVSISLPATARRLPLQLSKGDVAECPRCPQKAVLLSPATRVPFKELNQPAGGRLVRGDPHPYWSGKRVITTRGDVSSSLGLLPGPQDLSPMLVSKGPCSPQSMLRRPHTSQPQIRTHIIAGRAVATETTALSLVPPRCCEPSLTNRLGPRPSVLGGGVLAPRHWLWI